MDLFREEAVSHKRARLYGEVIVLNDRPSTVIICLLASICAITLGFALTATYHRSEMVSGAVVTSIPTVKVYGPKGGTVIRVMAQEGDAVALGQPLFLLSTDTALEPHRSFGEASLSSVERQLLLNSEQYEATRKQANLDEAAILSQIHLAEQEIDEARQQIDIQGKLVSLSELNLQRIEGLREKGFVSEVERERRRQEVLVNTQNFIRYKRELISLFARRDELRSRVGQIRQETYQQKTTLLDRRENLQQAQISVRGQATHIIPAPTSGRLSTLNVSVGRQLRADALAATIIPDGAGVEVELYAPTRAVGLMSPGQTVRLMYHAFPYKKYGSFEGQVVAISETISLPTEVDTPVRLQEAVYKIKVKPKNTHFVVSGVKHSLKPGMTLDGSVTLERQSFIDWLLQPVHAVSRRS